MSWMSELYNVYELAQNDGPLPVSHSTANAQVEVMIDEQGNFKGAYTVNKDDAETIIPVTEDSGSRTSGISPHPFADKLIYIAGDYKRHVSGKDADNAKYFSAYMNQLKKWRDSKNSHAAVSALYKYLEKAELMNDLIKNGVLQADPETLKLLPTVKIDNIAQKDFFVRFVISRDADVSQTWRDKTLYSSFIGFNREEQCKEQLCYATGEISPVTYKHPSKIRHAGDKAKLISSNDDNGFTYRGRFVNKEQALSVSYDFSQKAHNAIKWLIKEQGRRYDSLVLLIWASTLANLPDETNAKPIESEWEDEKTYDSFPVYKSRLEEYIMGFRQELKTNTKVMVMGLDAATTGRLSIALYEESSSRDFLESVKKWHEKTAWMRFRQGKESICSFSLSEIINAAYGSEQNGKLQCEEKLKGKLILRFLPCVTNGMPVPYDLIQNLYNKASNPLAYEERYNHRQVLETACGMYRAWKEGDIAMKYDPEETDRSYLYGCLLAIADKAESDTYDEGDRKHRVTNARRYWANFAQHPYKTWQTIETRLRPYLDRSAYRISVEMQLQEIMDKFTPLVFENNSCLDGLYLLGYHQYMAHMYRKKEDNNGNSTAQN